MQHGKKINTLLLFILAMIASLLIPGLAQAKAPPCWPEPTPTPFELRESSHSMVYYYLTRDEDAARWRLQSIKDMGVNKTLCLIYWWQCDTLGGDYWKKMGYKADDLNEGKMKAIDHYVNISCQLGMKPCLRLGNPFSELWHPMDKTGSIENYAKWLGGIAKRYRGKIDHYVLGDELNRDLARIKWTGTPKNYLENLIIPLSNAIRDADPDAEISTCGVASAPATGWLLELIELGLPKYADGTACNFWSGIMENPEPIINHMRKIRAVWPKAKFYSSGNVYQANRGLNDWHQAGVVAQSMFTLWDLGWDSAPYYLYKFSFTVDTRENYGIVKFPTETEPAQFSDGYKAYQTIAQTFYNRDDMNPPDFDISLRYAEIIDVADGTNIKLAPPAPILRTYIRDNNQLLIYLAYRKFREPQQGRWDVVLDTKDWAHPQQIPLLDYTARLDVPHHYEDGKLVIENLTGGLHPTIITLRKVKK